MQWFSENVFPTFPAYLQGMEIDKEERWTKLSIQRSQPTYKEWKLEIKMYPLGTEEVPSLPTRNGNKWDYVDCDGFFACSQPTYKEWKFDFHGQ